MRRNPVSILIMIGALVYAGLDVSFSNPKEINPYEFAFVSLVAVVAAIRSLKE